jgi:hypothetical protein
MPQQRVIWSKVQDAIKERFDKSKSQVQLGNMSGELYTNTSTTKGKKFAFFDPHPYVEVFLTLDTEIISLSQDGGGGQAGFSGKH